MQMSLKALRVNAGLTQQDVADRLGISRSLVIQLENGEKRDEDVYYYAFAYLYKADINNIRIPS